jgi:dTDP-4-dehydrorhamnose reductase
MKILIFGSNGMLGTYLKNFLSKKYEVVAITRENIDLSKSTEKEILEFLSKNVSGDDLIINSSGVIKQRDYIINDMISVNSIFPNILANFKKNKNCKIIHITTDCVFSGNKGYYTETDAHDCFDEYGRTKSLGENKDLTIIRTSIIGEEKQNKKSLLEWVISNKGKTIDGYDNHLWNGVTCLELTKLIDEIIKSNTYWIGVKHFFSPDTVSKFELVSLINEIYSLDLTINKKSTEKHCYRNLKSQYPIAVTKKISDQILELKEYDNN